MPVGGFGKLGFCLSLVPWASFMLAVVLRPGLGHPLNFLLGDCILVSTPLALALSLIGVFKDRPRGWAIAGLALSGMPGLLMLAELLESLCA